MTQHKLALQNAKKAQAILRGLRKNNLESDNILQSLIISYHSIGNELEHLEKPQAANASYNNGYKLARATLGPDHDLTAQLEQCYRKYRYVGRASIPVHASTSNRPPEFSLSPRNYKKYYITSQQPAAEVAPFGYDTNTTRTPHLPDILNDRSKYSRRTASSEMSLASGSQEDKPKPRPNAKDVYRTKPLKQRSVIDRPVLDGQEPLVFERTVPARQGMIMARRKPDNRMRYHAARYSEVVNRATPKYRFDSRNRSHEPSLEREMTANRSSLGRQSLSPTLRDYEVPQLGNEQQDFAHLTNKVQELVQASYDQQDFATLQSSVNTIQQQLKDIERAIVTQGTNRTIMPPIASATHHMSPPGRVNPNLSPPGKTHRPMPSQNSSNMINADYVGNKSATNIQKIWKGFQTRRKMNKRKNQGKGKRLDEAQSGLRVIKEQKMESEFTTRKLEKAMCMYKLRKKMKKRDAIIRKIQNWWRSRKIRYLFLDIKLAITIIQNAWRDYKFKGIPDNFMITIDSEDLKQEIQTKNSKQGLIKGLMESTAIPSPKDTPTWGPTPAESSTKEDAAERTVESPTQPIPEEEESPVKPSYKEKAPEELSVKEDATDEPNTKEEAPAEPEPKEESSAETNPKEEVSSEPSANEEATEGPMESPAEPKSDILQDNSPQEDMIEDEQSSDEENEDGTKSTSRIIDESNQEKQEEQV